MAITFPLSTGWYEQFGGNATSGFVTAPSPFNFGSGANRKCSAAVGYTNLTALPTGIVIGGTDTLSLVGSIGQGASGGAHFGIYQGDLTVSGSQVPVAHYTDSSGFSSGFAEINLLVMQGDGALTLANHIGLLEQFGGSAGNSGGRSVSSTVAGDLVILQGVEVGFATGSGTGGGSGSSVIANAAGAPFWAFKQTATGAPTVIDAAWSAPFDFYSFAFSITEAGGGGGGGVTLAQLERRVGRGSFRGQL